MTKGSGTEAPDQYIRALLALGVFDSLLQSMALHFILYEVVVTMARAADAPRRFVDELYERVCSRADQTMTPGEKAASAQTRVVLESFFSLVSRHL